VKHSFFIAALNGLQDLEEELAGHIFPQVPPARDIVKQVLGNKVPVLRFQKNPNQLAKSELVPSK
jgi:hypothetical protein